MDRLRGAFVVLQVLAISIVLLPVHMLARWRRWPLRKTTARTWHRLAARAMGLRIRVHGRLATTADHGVLIAANHGSWLDIVALGAIAPVSFIAKEEVGTWPVFGHLARLQDSVFVARNARASTRAQAQAIAGRLADGDAMVLFAEGTTSCGNFVLPFKSALFGALGMGGGEAGDKWVQPVAIAYVGADGIPLGRRGRQLAAWPGDVGMAAHLGRVLREGRIDIAVGFADPIRVTAQTDRKQLAAEAENAVRAMMSALLLGREPAFAAPEKPLNTAHEQS